VVAVASDGDGSHRRRPLLGRDRELLTPRDCEQPLAMCGGGVLERPRRRRIGRRLIIFPDH